MTIFVVTCILLAALLAGWAWRRTQLDSQFTPARKITPANRKNFKAVEICPGAGACQAAQDHAGKRLLIEHSPRLPLDKCDRIGDCNCTYINHSDRRAGDDRRNPYGSLSQAGVIGMRDANKRAGMDRRASANMDQADDEHMEHEA